MQNFLLTCAECGKPFFTEGENKFYKTHELILPKRCKVCRDARKTRFKAEKERQAQTQATAAKEIELRMLLEMLPYKQILLQDVSVLHPERTLYIIGNGFDIMHGAKSSYWDFQKTIGKHSEFRFHLETYLKCENLWGNFEDSLSHLDAGVMLDVVDMWLDNFGAYSPTASASDFYAAIDTAMSPIQVITHNLPKRFRQWVNTLSVEEEKKPFHAQIEPNARFLNFNYTEFLETVYGVKNSRINYIHGCRKNKRESLILGHVPYVNYLDGYEPCRGLVPQYKSKRKQYLLESAMEIAAEQWITYYDEMTSKKSPEIIATNKEFFGKLSDVEHVIVIGHSLSSVDDPYFKEIMKNAKNATWQIGWHSLDGVKRLIAFANRMNIAEKSIEMFRL